MNDVGIIDTKTSRLRRFIASMGEYGASVREMQRALWYMSHKGIRHAVFVSDLGVEREPEFIDVPRGYWCTNLYGTGARVGFLSRHCQKNSLGRWVLKQTAH